MRCREEWDLLRRHYRHVVVFARVGQAHKRTGSTEVPSSGCARNPASAVSLIARRRNR